MTAQDIQYIKALHEEIEKSKELKELRSDTTHLKNEQQSQGNTSEKPKREPIVFTHREGQVLSLLDAESSDDDDPEETLHQMLDSGDEDDDDKGLNGDQSKTKKGIHTEHEVETQIMSHAPMESIATGEGKTMHLGTVMSIVDGTVLVQADKDPSQIFDEGTLCCFEDGTVLGYIAEIFGSVNAPFYIFNYGSQEAVPKQALRKGTIILCSLNEATRVDPESLRKIKGSDASNPYDEEVDGEQVEFSDDEEEREYKRNLKKERQQKKKANVSNDIGSKPLPGKVAKQLYEQEGPIRPDEAEEFEFSDNEEDIPHLVTPGAVELSKPQSRPDNRKRDHWRLEQSDVNHDSFNTALNYGGLMQTPSIQQMPTVQRTSYKSPDGRQQYDEQTYTSNNMYGHSQSYYSSTSSGYNDQDTNMEMNPAMAQMQDQMNNMMGQMQEHMQMMSQSFMNAPFNMMLSGGPMRGFNGGFGSRGGYGVSRGMSRNFRGRGRGHSQGRGRGRGE